MLALGPTCPRSLRRPERVHLKDFAERAREVEVEDVGPLKLGLTNLYRGEGPCQLSLYLEWSEEAVTGEGIE